MPRENISQVLGGLACLGYYSYIYCEILRVFAAFRHSTRKILAEIQGSVLWDTAVMKVFCLFVLGEYSENKNNSSVGITLVLMV